MKSLYLLSVFLHILAAVTWVGGMIFLVSVVVPALRRPELQKHRGLLLHKTGVRFRQIGWLSLGLLVLTGIVNLAYRGFTWGDVWNGDLWSGEFGRTLGAKLLLVSVILVVSSVHDFVIGPLATRLMRNDPRSPRAERIRRQTSWAGRINLLLSLVVVALGIMLVRGLP